MQIVHVTPGQYLDTIAGLKDRGLVLIKAEKSGDMVAVTYGSHEQWKALHEQAHPPTSREILAYEEAADDE